MSDIKEVISQANLSQRISETKSKKSVRRMSRLPKCSPVKSHSVRPTTANTVEADEQTLDFPTRMKLKEKISELQQLNNELRFKLTTAEAKLKAKDSELTTADTLNKQIKHLLDKHINREQELNVQILSLEKKVTRYHQQINYLEEGKGYSFFFLSLVKRPRKRPSWCILFNFQFCKNSKRNIKNTRYSVVVISSPFVKIM